MIAPSPSRRAQYKNAGRCGRFKTELRKQCLDRLRNQRFTDHNSRRNLSSAITDAMRSAFQSSNADEVSEEERLQICEELMAQLLVELQEEFEAVERQREEELEAVLALQESTAFCPKCRLNPLTVDTTGMACQACQFAFRIGSRPVSEDELHHLFQAAFAVHSESGCRDTPEPAVVNDHLFIACSRCQLQTLIV